jgi:hypothetical protein
MMHACALPVYDPYSFRHGTRISFHRGSFRRFLHNTRWWWSALGLVGAWRLGLVAGVGSRVYILVGTHVRGGTVRFIAFCLCLGQERGQVERVLVKGCWWILLAFGSCMMFMFVRAAMLV